MKLEHAHLNSMNAEMVRLRKELAEAKATILKLSWYLKADKEAQLKKNLFAFIKATLNHFANKPLACETCGGQLKDITCKSNYVTAVCIKCGAYVKYNKEDKVTLNAYESL